MYSVVEFVNIRLIFARYVKLILMSSALTSHLGYKKCDDKLRLFGRGVGVVWSKASWDVLPFIYGC